MTKTPKLRGQLSKEAQAAEAYRQRMAELTETNFPKPEITEEMKQELREIIGESSLKKKPGLDPDNLHPYYDNTRPSYELNGTRFEADQGPETWDNAWETLLEQIKHLKKANII